MTTMIIHLFLLVSSPIWLLAAFIQPPTDRYHVGIRSYVWNHTNLDDPLAPNNISASLLLNLFYHPTRSLLKSPRPYLDPVTAQLYASAWNYSSGAFKNLTTTLQWEAPFLNGTSSYPTLLPGPGGGGPPSAMYTALLSDLAPHGYNILAIDRPYEQPFVHYPLCSNPYGGPQLYGLPVVYSFPLHLFHSL
ncbi:hypothetical protein K402DRAFT_395031 [Aulographum hederae CBS 113979]|uniref:Uncharacterized protein n=1 Tax=Aulographum hederae CBS 113979 TaxID=1176131 RepID=A0A6G1GVJ5_9PEZI|nr:hypothetical protein K402DRAFT_395031 [Aulographum hederae CBS 113979]